MFVMKLQDKVELPFKLFLLGFVRAYQIIVSPLLPACCRFYPSCSVYAAEALRKKPLIKAVGMILWRLARCQPFCKGGYDPVE